MRTQTADKAVPTPTRTYGARFVYILALAVLTVMGFFGSAYVSDHERHVGIVMWALTGLYLLALATVASLRVGVHADGLTQRWLFSRLLVRWRDISRLEKTRRGYALRDGAGKDVGLLFLLPRGGQQAIADAVIDRARLRPARTPPQAPILELWERK